MKKPNVLISVVLTLVLMLAVFTGCSSQKGVEKQTETPSSTKSTIQTDNAKQDKDAKSITGTISDIKDFMLVVTDDDNNAYSMSFESKPDGLDKVKDGDKVTITYTGELSPIDAFTGTIISIEKAD